MTGDFEKQLGRKIAYFRRVADMTQQTLAERIRVAPETISRIETGALAPSLNTLLQIGEGLGVEIREFFDFQLKGSSKDRDLKMLFYDLKDRSPKEIRKIHRIVREVLDLDKKN